MLKNIQEVPKQSTKKTFERKLRLEERIASSIAAKKIYEASQAMEQSRLEHAYTAISEARKSLEEAEHAIFKEIEIIEQQQEKEIKEKQNELIKINREIIKLDLILLLREKKIAEVAEHKPNTKERSETEKEKELRLQANNARNKAAEEIIKAFQAREKNRFKEASTAILEARKSLEEATSAYAKSEQIDIRKQQEKEIKELDEMLELNGNYIKLELKEKEITATKIQAAFRGHQVRTPQQQVRTPQQNESLVEGDLWVEYKV